MAMGGAGKEAEIDTERRRRDAGKTGEEEGSHQRQQPCFGNARALGSGHRWLYPRNYHLCPGVQLALHHGCAGFDGAERRE